MIQKGGKRLRINTSCAHDWGRGKSPCSPGERRRAEECNKHCISWLHRTLYNSFLLRFLLQYTVPQTGRKACPQSDRETPRFPGAIPTWAVWGVVWEFVFLTSLTGDSAARDPLTGIWGLPHETFEACWHFQVLLEDCFQSVFWGALVVRITNMHQKEFHD